MTWPDSAARQRIRTGPGLAGEEEHAFINTMNIPNGLVLSGGKSTRMGKDKSLIAYHGGKPQREYVFDLLSECCDNVFTSCRKEQEIPKHLNPLPDRYDFGGPVNGILSAFALHPDKAWLVVAVDMPNVTSRALQTLLSQRDPNRLATVFLTHKKMPPNRCSVSGSPRRSPFCWKMRRKETSARGLFCVRPK